MRIIMYVRDKHRNQNSGSFLGNAEKVWYFRNMNFMLPQNFRKLD